MSHHTITAPYLKKDLILIAVLVVIIAAVIMGIWYADYRTGMFNSWAASFYNFIMRR
ncbi:MAG: hypothetical protein KIH62_003340 [Candidatus Kerfeldbacteria bacterium]|nr:hypothetical protein [Candidatus Kerfeldbacteria bacterium]